MLSMPVVKRRLENVTVKTVLDQRSTSDRPRYHAHTRWTLPLPLTLAALRASPR